MHTIVLVSLAAKYIHSSLAIWDLAGGIARYGETSWEPRIVEATIRGSAAETAARIALYKPEAVGIGTYIWNAKLLPGLLEKLRELLPEAVLILGGPEASHNAAYWLQQGADYVLRGEGERSLPALLDALANGKPEDLEGIAGLCRLCDGLVLCEPEGRAAEEWIDPYDSVYFASLKGRIAYLESSRGCPFRCAFCLSGESRVKYLPLDKAKEQLDRLSRSGAQTIKLVDRTFNCDPSRSRDLFSYVIGLDTTCCFHFEVAADLFTEDALTLLATAKPGRIQLEAGLQSFYEPALQAVSRHTDCLKAERSLRKLLRGGNIHIHIDLIAGLPYERLSDFMKSFDRAYRLGAHTLQLGFLKLLHGSRLRKQADSLGIRYDKEAPYEILESPWLSPHDLAILKYTENALDRTYNKGRFLSALRYLLSVTGLRPFALFRAIGEAVPNHGMPLEAYGEQIYRFAITLPEVNAVCLRDRMVCDWLSMTGGKNMPAVLRRKGERCAPLLDAAEIAMGRKAPRSCAAMLSDGQGVFADLRRRDPVTGLYKLC